MLFIFTIGSTLYVSNSTNTLLFEAYVELETAKSIEQTTPAINAQRKMLERKIEIATKNKKFFIQGLMLISAISGWLMFYGFLKWHREIQPIQDEIARLQRDKLRIEIDSIMLDRQASLSITDERPTSST
ncbi:hypothetical protein GCM10007205_17870 [Oxalicibacterium flavum]|uniref:Uncharacterized protein n=1 Tax=Oxalicibacterium flavum TaxID=179467 RepID=A0A8J2UKU8_9BURK|nr:hypothetical protein GCM10007205_17870 [Oxalicibacterium flavum]